MLLTSGEFNLKKKLLVILFSLICINLFTAEITIGIRTGIGLSANLTTPSYSGIMDINNSHPDTSSGSSSIFAFNSGMFASFLFKEANYGFEFQINYKKYGSLINNELNGNEEKLVSYGIELALPFKMSLLCFYGPSTDVHHPYILIGPLIYLPVISKLNGNDILNKYNDINIGIIFTLGGRFRLRGRNILFIELVFKALLSDELEARGKLRNFSFTFCFGYELKISKSEWD